VDHEEKKGRAHANTFLKQRWGGIGIKRKGGPTEIQAGQKMRNRVNIHNLTPH